MQQRMTQKQKQTGKSRVAAASTRQKQKQKSTVALRRGTNRAPDDARKCPCCGKSAWPQPIAPALSSRVHSATSRSAPRSLPSCVDPLVSLSPSCPSRPPSLLVRSGFPFGRDMKDSEVSPDPSSAEGPRGRGGGRHVCVCSRVWGGARVCTCGIFWVVCAGKDILQVFAGGPSARAFSLPHCSYFLRFPDRRFLLVW